MLKAGNFIQQVTINACKAQDFYVGKHSGPSFLIFHYEIWILSLFIISIQQVILNTLVIKIGHIT